MRAFPSAALAALLALGAQPSLAAPAAQGSVVRGRITWYEGSKSSWNDLTAVGTWRAPMSPAFSEQTKWVSEDARVYCGFEGTLTWRHHFYHPAPPPKRDQLSKEERETLRKTIHSLDASWSHTVKIDEDASDLCAMFDDGGGGASLGLLRFDKDNGHLAIEPARASAWNNQVDRKEVVYDVVNMLGEKMDPPGRDSVQIYRGFFLDQGTWSPKAASAEGRWAAPVERSPDPDDPEVNERWVTWSLSFRDVELEVLVFLEPMPDQEGHFAPKWDEWLPQGGPDEKTAGATLGVTAQLSGKDGSPTQRKAKFTFTLRDVSRQPGTCINQPLKGATAGPDLAFQASRNPQLAVLDDGLRAVSVELSTSKAALLSSFDWGAWGTLEVTAELDDGTALPMGRLKDRRALTSIPIPWREGSTHIAAAWRKQTGFQSEPDDWDGEIVPRLDGKPGDGLTLYEEYRGLFARGKHLRLEPAKGVRARKLVVANEAGAEAGLGLDLLSRASRGASDAAGIRVVDVSRDELHAEEGEAKLLNFNHDGQTPRGGDQHGLLAVTAKLAGSESGQCVPIPGVTTPKSPRETLEVRVSSSALKLYGPEKVSADLAHELAHALGVRHHGDKDPVYIPSVVRADSGQRVFDVNREVLPLPFPPTGSLKRVIGGKPQSAQSGDVGCLMHYDEYYSFAVHDGPGGRDYYNVPKVPPGEHLCTSAAGTGYNAKALKPPLFGDADKGRGDCLGHVHLKDW